MKLRLVTIQYEGKFKTLILDDNKTKEEGKLVAFVTARTEKDAKDEAKDLSEAIYRGGGKVIWN